MYSSQKSNKRPLSLAASDAGNSNTEPPRGVGGATFGAYVLEACIEQGPMGRVYRAEHQGLKRRVALKVLDAACGSVIDVGRFIEQARAAASVRHPAIVNIFDAGIHGGSAYVVTDLVEGVSLRDFIAERGPLDEATIIDIAVPLASALVALHGAGLIHDDLNPSRVFLSEVGAGQMRARMVDVTHSKLWQASRSASGVSAIASPLYMAPEVVLGGLQGPLTDQYGLGLLMYECATGVNPFAHDDARASLQRITAGEVEPLSARKSLLSKRLVALIERAMHVDPTQRFSDMAALGHELSAAAGRRTRITWGLGTRELAEHGGADRPSQPDPLPSPRRRHRRGSRLLGWAALLLLGGLALKGVDAFSTPSRENPRDTAAPTRHSNALEPRPTPPVPASTGETARSTVTHDEPVAPADLPDDDSIAAADLPDDSIAPADLPDDSIAATDVPSLELDVPSRPQPPAPKAARAATREEARPAPRRPRAVKPAPEPPAPSAAPDWMIAPESPAPQRSFERGTNEALILD